MTKGNFRSYLMWKFILNCSSALADLEEQGDINDDVKSFLILHLLSLFKTSCCLCYLPGLIPNLICAIFQIKCSKDCLFPPVE